MPRPLPFIMYAKRALITQMLFAILTEFPRVILFTLLTNNLKHNMTIHFVNTHALVFPQMMIIRQMLFKAGFALNNLTL